MPAIYHDLNLEEFSNTSENWKRFGFILQELTEFARERTPSGLDADDLIARSWVNTADSRTMREMVDCFLATHAMYLDDSSVR